MKITFEPWVVEGKVLVEGIGKQHQKIKHTTKTHTDTNPNHPTIL